MAPKATILSSEPDPFEAYNELVRRGRRSWAMALVSALTTLLAMALAFMSFTRPLPVVVTSDDPLEPRRIASAGDTSAREVDAKRFFAKAATLLHGWTSANVAEQLTEASFLMTTPWRKHFAAEMNGEVPVPAEVDASRKASLLRTYALARIRNELEIDWPSLACAKDEGAWHCKGAATMRIQPITGTPVDDPKFKKRLSIHATFVEIPVTTYSIDGLLIDFWDAKEEQR